MVAPCSKRRTHARRRAFAPLAAVACVAVGLAGCATYTERTEGAMSAFQRGQLKRAAKRYSDVETTGSTFLSGAEAGTVALAGGDWPRAISEFERASEFVEEFEDRTLLSPDALGKVLVQWTISESARDYYGEGYERVQLHACAGIAYLALGRFDDARVEVRRANAILENEEKLYESKYRAGGLGHFISALSYELEGKYDEAYIDYRRMEEKGVGAPLAGQALLRIAQKLHFPEADQWAATYGPAPEPPADTAHIVIVGGVGLGPYKQEIGLTLPTGSGLIKWSVPKYHSRSQPVERLELNVAGGSQAVRTVVIEDVDRVARKNLDDRIAWLATRSAVRAAVKRELAQQMDDWFHGLGLLIGNLVILATERADLRSWQTLPHSWQAARAFVPPGTHDLSLRALGGPAVDLGAYELEPGETLLVFARSVGTRLYAHVVGGRPAAPTAAGPAPATHLPNTTDPSAIQQ